MIDNYPKAYKEAIEILKYVPKDDVNKIPLKVLEIFNKNMDKDYEYKIDENEKFENQKLLKETKVILANIYIKYWASEKEREQIDKIYSDVKRKSEEEKIKKYGTEIIFDKKNENSNVVDERDKPIKNLIVYNEIKWYDKFLNFFKNLFKSKK